MSVYIGNLSNEVEDEQLKQVLSRYGSVKRILVSTKHRTGEKRGFAVVEMATDAQEMAAIEALRGTEWMGHSLKVSRPKTV